MRSHRRVQADGEDSTAWLADWHVLDLKCGACGHRGKLYWSRVRARVAPGTRMGDLERRFRCKACGNRQGNQLSIGKLPRD